MNSELIFILHSLRKDLVKASTLCDHVINDFYSGNHKCGMVECKNCPIKNKYKSSGEHFITQMTLTMEAVNHETRNSTFNRNDV